MKGSLVPFFDHRVFKSIRKEKHRYFSLRVGYGRKGELPYLLNETGLDIIKFCDGKHSRSDIVDEMSKLYKNVSLDRLSADVEEFLERLTKSSALLWIGETWIPHSSWVERISGGILAACEPECWLLTSQFLNRSENTHILLSSDGEGHCFDPILHGGCARSSLMLALLDQDNRIKVIVMFTVVDYGMDVYLNFDRIDLRVDSDIKWLKSILCGSIRIIDSMYSEQPKPSRIRVWMRESLPQKNIFIECLNALGFVEEVRLKTGLFNSVVTGYSQDWNSILEGVA